MPTVPISISGHGPIPKTQSMPNLSKSFPPSPSNSPQIHTLMKRVVLYGTPFKDKTTLAMLLRECVEEIDSEKADKIIREAEKKDFATIITCDEKKAFRYCQSLVENGLIAKIE